MDTNTRDRDRAVGRSIGKSIGDTSWTVTVILSVLKIVHLIDWSWLWVLSPTWGVLLLALLLLGIGKIAE